jgi:hypothetical protein
MLKLIRTIFAVVLAITEVSLVDALTVLALELVFLSAFGLNILILGEALVEVVGSESQPLGFTNGELPGSSTVAASLGTVEFEDVVTSVEGDAEVELLRFTTLPDAGLGGSNDLAVHHGDSSTAKVNWDLEFIIQTVIAHWEGDSVIESNIVLDTLAQGLVANLQHVVDLSLTVSFSRWFGHLLLELSDLDNSRVLELSGLNPDLSFSQGGFSLIEDWFGVTDITVIGSEVTIAADFHNFI